MRALRIAPVYLALAAATTWPAAARIGVEVPGAERTDLWNGLWSLWFVARALARGELPYETRLLNHPAGGTLLVADPLGALAAAPLVWLLGLPAAWSLLVLARLALAGVVAQLFAEEWLRVDARLAPAAAARAAWIAGVGWATAPVLRSAVHNGNSEAVDGACLALAAWACWRAARHGGARRALAAAGALVLAALASWYDAVAAFLFAGALLVVGTPAGWRRHLRARLLALALGIALVAPWAALVRRVATGPHNLVGIKDPEELALVRRTIGAADPLGYVAPGDFRSPDFRVLSRYGEQYFHCHYLGYALLLGAGLALRRGRRRGTGFLWLAGGLGAVLSLGPVLVHDGFAVIVMGDRAIPLPYLLLERLPGFASLSLLWRLAKAPALALSLLAARGFGGARAAVPAGVALAVLLEGRLLCPLGPLPDTVDARVAPAVEALAEMPPGAVINFPVAGGRAYLYEQTVHGHPLAGTLNFPNNAAALRVWRAMLDAADEPPDRFRERVAAEARRRGVRYVVVHVDPMARPDMHDEAVRALKRALDPAAGSEGTGSGPEATGSRVRVYRLW